MKRNIRLFSMLLALICVVSMLPVMTVSAEPVDLASIADGGTYTDANNVVYTVVKSYDELNKHTTMSGNLILGADIDYTDKAHNGINLNGHILDGNGYAIYGITVTNNGGNTCLFGAGGTGNEIRNLTIGLPGNEISLTGNASGKSSGVILGWTSGASVTFDNVDIYAKITTNKHHVGAFVGNVGDGGVINIKNCSFHGSMTDAGGNNSGGFVGKAGGTSVVTIENSVNYASVSNTANTGGFVGELYNTANVTVKNCVNAGSISGGTTGGFVGTVGQTGCTVTVENSVNIGDVTSKNPAGGIVGWTGYNGTTITMKNVANFGVVTSNGTEGAGGLIHRFNNKLTLENCGSFSSVVASSQFGAVRATKGWDAKAVTNLYYTPITGAGDEAYLASDATAKSLAEGIAWTNELLGDILGEFILNTDGNGVTFAAPAFVGVQESIANAGDIRLVATLGDSLRYAAVGFKVELEGGNTVTQECNSVYNALLSTNEQGFQSKVNASDVYGTYLYALTITGIPTEGTITLKVTPYAKDSDGTTVYESGAYNVVYTNGAVVSVHACA